MAAIAGSVSADGLRPYSDSESETFDPCAESWAEGGKATARRKRTLPARHGLDAEPAPK